MNPSRLVFLIVAGFSLLLPPSVNAQAPGVPPSTPASVPPSTSASAQPFTPDKEFSADQVATTKLGINMSGKIYMSDGKARAEMEMQGAQMVAIMRVDQKKMFMVMPAQKMVMVTNLDDQMMQQINAASGDDGKFETVGPETLDGVAHEQIQNDGEGRQGVLLVGDGRDEDAGEMTADDGSVTLNWKNYKAGPQDPALFEVPKDYQVMRCRPVCPECRAREAVRADNRDWR